MNKIILTGLRDIKTDEVLDEQTDYGVFLIASMIEKAYPCTHSEEEKDEIKYKLKVERVDQIYDLKKKKDVEFSKGQSPSQKLRWRITEKLGAEEYENYIGWLIANSERLTDEYIEQLNIK